MPSIGHAAPCHGAAQCGMLRTMGTKRNPDAAVARDLHPLVKSTKRTFTKSDVLQIEITKAAARNAARDGLPAAELTRIREMEARAHGSFTREIGRLVLRTGISPLEFLIREMRDVSNPKELRVRCAVDALPYIHAKLPSEMKVDAPAGATINFVNVQQTQLANLSDAELENLSRLAEKLQPPIDVEAREV
jgi:hypothetical protein